LGYGNVVPINPFVGMLATSEAVIGQFYVATVIARLVLLAYNKPPADGW
jgi:Na+/H+-dicarboxylate symporter